MKLGTVGLGGYGATICSLLEKESSSASPILQLSAVCEPDQALHADRVAALRQKGVKVFERYEDFLAEPLDAVWLPLPIDLHRPFTEQALLSGKAVLCEKPAAGCVDDLDSMVSARDQADLPVAIGFQDIYDPTTLLLKQKLLHEEIGKVQSVTLVACWPRDDAYYSRSGWAGRLRRNGAWVLDSPASNALAHYVNLVLFLLGDEEQESAALLSVEAELYRANSIENYDTCGLRIITAGGVPIVVLFTHACQKELHPQIQIYGKKGSLSYASRDTAEIQSPKGVESFSLRAAPHPHMLQRFVHLVQGTADDRAVATLEVARAHLTAVNGASEAAPIRTVPPSAIHTVLTGSGHQLRAIQGIEELFTRCAREGVLPHESGQANWTAPGGQRDLQGYSHFGGPAGSKKVN